MPEPSEREIEVFNAALELTLAERIAYLDQVCAGDAALRQRVEELLQVGEQAGRFLESPTAVPQGPGGIVNRAPVTTAKPRERIGRYKLLQQIGEGGCGVVYMAEQEEPVHRRVALKIIKLGLDTKSVIARFEAERQALALMDHPNIARVLDAGATETGRPYFVMELVKAIPITRYCDENNLSTVARLGLFVQVCQAIQHAHQKGIIHRDIKPSNILVADHDGVPVPKIIDFGIAKATTDQRLTDKTLFTALEQFIGTPAYMSPEQARLSGLDIDTRSDIYSLGVLLYELLTGKTPFESKRLLEAGLDEIRRIIREEEPLPPSTRLHTLEAKEQTTVAKRRQSDPPKLEHLIRGDLDWIVMKCLEKDRGRRYETANGLAMDIQRHLANEPVIARPPSAAYKFQKAFRRNKLAYSAAIAVLVALVVGLGSATVMFFRERVALKSEQQLRVEAQSAQKAAETERQHSRQLVYDADISLAQQALKLDNLGRARQLLELHRPKPGEEDLRGWEWRYLWQLTRSTALVTLTNRPVRGWSVSFSPDGSRLAVGWYDARVDLWDVPGRRWLRTLTEGRKEQYTGQVAFSPVRNLLAATAEPNTVRLYDLDSDRDSVLWKAPEEGGWDILELTFSQDGSKVVIYAGSFAASHDVVWVVDVSSRKIESRHEAEDNAIHGTGAAARLSPDNKLLYLGHADASQSRHRIQCLDLTTGREVWQTEDFTASALTALALSADGRFLASASGDPNISIWDAATGKPLHQLEGHTSWVSKLVFTRDGHRLISAASDQTIRLWDTETWTNTKVLRGHVEEVNGLAISEAAQLIASADRDGNLMLWKAETPGVSDGYLLLPEHLRTRWASDLGPVCMLHGSSNPPEFFDLSRGVSLGTPPGLGDLNLLGAWPPGWIDRWDGTNQIIIEEWSDSQLRRRGAVTLDRGRRPITADFSPEKRLLAWAERGASNSVFLASLATPGQRNELKGGIAGPRRLLFSQDGKYLAAFKWLGASANFSQVWDLPPLCVWNVETRQSVMTLSESVNDIAFAAGGRVLVALVLMRGIDHEIRFYDLEHPDRPPRVVPGKDLPRAIEVSQDGRLVAFATGGGTVRICDAVTGEWIDDLHGHLNEVEGLAFSKDAHRLVSAGSGLEAVKLWDFDTRQELLTLPGNGFRLTSAWWSADEDTILAGTPWQTWHAPSWEEIAAAEAKDPPSPGYGGQGKADLPRRSQAKAEAQRP